jgi:hypothetical protein
MKLVIKKNKTVKKKVKLMPTANNSKNILSLIGFDKVYKANTSLTSLNSILGLIKGVHFYKSKIAMKQFVSKINLYLYI